MARGCNFRLLAVVVLLAFVVGEHWVAAEVQCSDAVSQLLPCETFLMFGAGTPSEQCCSGVQSLGKIAAASRDDKRTICRCFKAAATSLPIDFTKAAQLPQLCHVSLDVTISPNVDCDRI